MPEPSADPRVRVPLKLPQSLLTRIDADADRRGMTRTAWMERAALAQLDGGSVESAAPRPRRPTHADLKGAVVTQIGPESQDAEGRWSAVGTVEGFGDREWPVAYSENGHRGPWLMPGVSREMPAHGEVVKQITAGLASARSRAAQQGRRGGIQTSATARAGVKPIPKGGKS